MKRKIVEYLGSTYLWGSDRDFNVLSQARSNAERCGIEEQITFLKLNCSQLGSPGDRGIPVVIHLSERLGDATELGLLQNS